MAKYTEVVIITDDDRVLTRRHIPVPEYNINPDREPLREALRKIPDDKILTPIETNHCYSPITHTPNNRIQTSPRGAYSHRHHK